MDEKLKPLTEWRDEPHICSALDFIRDGADPVQALVDALVGLAEHARYAEDYTVIHKLNCKND